MTPNGILENLISDVIFIVAIIALTWGWHFLTHRRKLKSFFRTNNTNRLVIYLSDLNILPFGAIGSLGRKISYGGHAVAYGEVEGANQIRSLFSFIIPKLAEVFQSIGTMFLSDATVQVLIAPEDSKDVDHQASFIALGSAASNRASGYIESLDKGAVKFESGSLKLSDLGSAHPTIALSSTDPQIYPGGTLDTSAKPGRYPTGSTTQSGIMDSSSQVPDPMPSSFMPPNLNDPAPPYSLSDAVKGPIVIDDSKPSAIIVEGIPPITNTSYGIVERIIDTKQNRALFYVAGLSEFSTKAASYYLASNWLELYKKYDTDKSFIVMLHFDDFGNGTVKLEREITKG